MAATFSGVACDSPKFEAFMLSKLGHGKSDATGQPMPTRFGYGPIVSAATIANTGNRITCKVAVRLNAPRAIKTVQGVFTATAGSAGRNSWHWAPNG